MEQKCTIISNRRKISFRAGNSANNFSKTLPSPDSDLANNVIKDPYIFDFITLKDGYKEKALGMAMINRIWDVLLERGIDINVIMKATNLTEKQIRQFQ